MNYWLNFDVSTRNAWQRLSGFGLVNVDFSIGKNAWPKLKIKMVAQDLDTLMLSVLREHKLGMAPSQ